MPIATAAPPPTVADAPDLSPFAIAQDGLAGLVDAAVQARRLEAMQAAMRVDVINLASTTRCAALMRSRRRPSRPSVDVRSPDVP
jgi:hypothetical protein